MKLQCEQCGTQYNVADERVRGEGRVFKFRCRNCDSIITFHGVADGSQAESASEAPTWYFVKDGQQVGPVALAELRQSFSSGSVTADTYVWRAGMADWQPLKEVDELASLRPSELGDDVVRRLETSEVLPAAQAAVAAAASAPAAGDNTLDRLFVGDLSSAAKAPAAAHAAAPAGETDLFGDVDGSPEGDIFSSTGPGSREKPQGLKHQRHDNSVLFKLDDDDKKGGGKAAKRAASTGLGGDSGLIDIRSFSKKKKDDGKAADLFGDIGGAAAPAAGRNDSAMPLAVSASAVSMPILVKKKKGGGGTIAAIIIGSALIAGGTTFAVIHFTKEKAVPVAPAAPVAVAVAPEKPAEKAPDAPPAAAPAAPVAAVAAPAAAAPAVAPPAAPVDPAAAVPPAAGVAPAGDPAAAPVAPTAPVEAVAPVAPAAPAEPKRELTPAEKKKLEELRKKREEDRKAAEAARAAAPKPEPKPKPAEVVKPSSAPPAIDPNKLLGETQAAAPKPATPEANAGGSDLPDSLTNGQVSKVMRPVAGRIRSCVTGAGETNVTVTVAFQVTASGGVSGVSVSGTGASGCVSGAVSGLSFPASKNGRSVRLPFAIQ